MLNSRCQQQSRFPCKNKVNVNNRVNSWPTCQQNCRYNHSRAVRQTSEDVASGIFSAFVTTRFSHQICALHQNVLTSGLVPYADPEIRRVKQAEFSKRYYEKNKAQIIAKLNERKKLGRKKWQQFKATLECTNCGEGHPATLDFHHIDRHDPSNRKVYELVKNGMYARAITEIRTKCMVLCANCHRKHHHAERKHKPKGKKKPKRC